MGRIKQDKLSRNGRFQRCRLFGMPVDIGKMQDFVDEVDEGLKAGQKRRTLLAMNPEKIYALAKDEELKNFFEKSAMVEADGVGIVWAVRMLIGIRSKRVTGADLMQELCDLAAKRGYRIFLFGSREEINAGSADILPQRYPGLQIAGRRNGYVKEEEMDDLVAEINEAKVDMLFVAMGSPRQELWIQKHIDELEIGLAQGIGGTLDTITGHVLRAHPIVQAMGLEWLSRLIREPHRIKRQAKLPKFVWRVLMAKLRLRPS